MNQSAKELEEAVNREVSKVIIGKSDRIRLITAALLEGGHILLEDLPGVGKTTLVKCLARVLGCSSKRIQFTPDMLPSDIVGMNIYDRNTGEFRLLKGPVVTNLLLADELNRAIPRTQSALLEAMEERQITIDGNTEKLPKPFCVLATQNPVESESTFRLPAAQTDRFLICLSLGYPTAEEEMEMLRTVGNEIAIDRLEIVTGPEKLTQLSQEIQDEVRISDEVAAYIVGLCAATRCDPCIKLGASPRATRSLYRVSKCLAAISGRDYVTPDDVKELAGPVLCHRIMLSSRASMEGKTPKTVIDELLDAHPVPPETKTLFDGHR